MRSLRILAVVAGGAAVACAVSGCERSVAVEATAPAAEEPIPVKGAFDHYHKHTDERPVDPAATAAAVKAYSPYAGKPYPTRVFFGDTHHHTANSGDAFMAGDRLSPEQSYRLARGEEVVSSTGVPLRLSRPLDFLVVSDHAEGLGLMFQVFKKNPALMKDPTVAGWAAAMNGSPQEQAKTTSEVISAQAQGTLPPIIKDPNVVGPLMRSVWTDYTATAERFNDPGRFTAMIGYEWTSVPGGNNLHRNVLFRDGKAQADQVFPFSAWNSEDPEKLWEWMRQYEHKTGGKVLAIPHNGNLSNGRMFELVDFQGNSFTKDYAERRARWEVLQEVVQTKGNSETHPILSPTDEFAGDLGVAGWEYGNLTLEGEPLSPTMMPTNYLRAGLLRGLELEAKLGANPFKFGFAGGTDVHNSLTAIEEDNFFGKWPAEEPSPQRALHESQKNFGKVRYGWHVLAAGYTGVWATENTREALWDALKRREAYGTSGSRITLRFFGGWTYTRSDADLRELADKGYAKGVPMGADLPARPAGSMAPTFLVAAIKDPLFGNLDRIQIVKGWLDRDGKGREKVHDVVWAHAERRKFRQGRLDPVGDTVDVAKATWKNTIGEPELAAVWTDPDFDRNVRAFYYARVIEIPTPRWVAYDAVRLGVRLPPNVPVKQQERAWASPIWYSPAQSP